MHPTSGEQVSFESEPSEELKQTLELLKSN
jgi:hypothetical protein